ncbi:serine/threonine protein kinase domain protein [Metarhizium robertsii]|uniref:non-specific serine/threonine protein kinase n=2 Tax=Metarhizium robertsii TaxID=568076 RepID=E9ETB9_METRA|nr:Protein kinase, catalytic domain protein [Metarhizium robertsii ARSEF 23]EFZ00672.1 Protein kinase, catalytic domain protein [Metarhizium robertsii ARSEF 23]EXU94982.1 serine/threonine protein kinase domain protein [Metarhizium robertsii]
MDLSLPDQAPHRKTLFHLVPSNRLAEEALAHPDNERFVSRARNGRYGLEVGYHVSSLPRGHVITRLGRNADLILRKTTPENPMSTVHVAFEINPSTRLIVLSVRSKRPSTVYFSIQTSTAEDDGQGGPGTGMSVQQELQGATIAREQITGQGVILFGQAYSIFIANYTFRLIWQRGNSHKDVEFLKALAFQGYQESVHRMQYIGSRERPTEYDPSELISWHMTRLNTVKGTYFSDVPDLRTEIGSGAFGTVYAATDQVSGYEFAIKVIHLQDHPNPEEARALVHREIKILQRLSHKHIIEYLDYNHFHTLNPEILMPLREGSLKSLIKEKKVDVNEHLFLDVVTQMLSALDYLASESLVHRDVKPENILYYPSGKIARCGYHFQLADFGFAHHHDLATSKCGTGFYRAPEMVPEKSKVDAPQSHKMDVWSLFATMVAVDSTFESFPIHTSDYGIVLEALLAKARESLLYAHMGRLHPDRRASAAQILSVHFAGWGLTTPQSRITPIEPELELQEATCTPQTLLPTAGPSAPRGMDSDHEMEDVHEMKNNHEKPRQKAAAPLGRLITYPPSHKQRDTLARVNKNGVGKRRARRSARPSPRQQKLPVRDKPEKGSPLR